MARRYKRKINLDILGMIFFIILILMSLFFLIKNISRKSNFNSICGNEICEFDESLELCFKDCKEKEEYCGDGVCQPNEDGNLCKEDCETILAEFPREDESIIQPNNNPVLSIANNDDTLINKLREKQRPVSSGLEIVTMVEKVEGTDRYIARGCTLGGIIEILGQRYGITAEHCLTKNIIANKGDVGNMVFQGRERIGEVLKTANEDNVDLGLISIDDQVKTSYDTFLGHKIEGFGKSKKGMEVFKIGRTTGITYGVVTDDNILVKDRVTGVKYRSFEIKGIGGVFAESGDSGSAIITKNKPHRIIGIIILGGGRIIDILRGKERGYAQHIEDVIDKVSLREFVGVHNPEGDIFCYDSDGANLWSKGYLNLFDNNGNKLIETQNDLCNPEDQKYVLEQICIPEEDGWYYIESEYPCPTKRQCYGGKCV